MSEALHFSVSGHFPAFFPAVVPESMVPGSP